MSKTKQVRLNQSTIGKQPSGHADATKQPAAAPSRYEDRQIRFRFGRLDPGKWTLSTISRDHHKRLLNRLAYFETLTVAQARSTGILADYDMSDCPNQQAAVRLASQYDGQDALCRLKVDGPMRLMGIREQNEFHIVWWDPNHEVWPEGKIRR